MLRLDRMSSPTFPRACKKPNFIEVQPKCCPGNNAVCHTEKGIPFMSLMETQTLVFRIVVGETSSPIANLKLGVQYFHLWS
jgi:hypothetical protein